MTATATAKRSKSLAPKPEPQNEFGTLYRKNAEGFYVRKQNPSQGTLSKKRIVENVRDLLRDIESLP